MTLDVTFGKLEIEPITENDLVDYESCNAINALTVKPCPDSSDFVSKGTLYPKGPCRSGSFGFWRFFGNLSEIYSYMRYNPETNDKDVAFVKPVLAMINKLPDLKETEHEERMKWFKYWANKSVEMYDNMAVIKFG